MGSQPNIPSALDTAKQRANTPGGTAQATPFADIIRASQGGVDPQQYIRQTLGLGAGQRATPSATNAAVLGASNPQLIQQFLAQHSANVGTPGFLRQQQTPLLPPEDRMPPPPPTTGGQQGTMSPVGTNQGGIPPSLPAGRPWANSMPPGFSGGAGALSPMQMQAFNRQQLNDQQSAAAAAAQQRAAQAAAAQNLVTRAAPPLRRAPAPTPPPAAPPARSPAPAPRTNLSDLAYLVTGLHRAR